VKDLTKKVLESGLIDKHLAILMERWGFLEPGASEHVGSQFQTTAVILDSRLQYGRKDQVRKILENFVEDLEILLQPESLEREIVRLD
jgi:hypothetical protein